MPGLTLFVALCTADVTRRSVLFSGEQRGRKWILERGKERKKLGGVREEFKKRKKKKRASVEIPD